MTTSITQEQNKWNNTNPEFIIKKRVMNYFPKVTSDTNTLVVRMKNDKKSVSEIQSAVALFVFQEVVNHPVAHTLRGASFVCPDFTTVLDYKFSLINTAVIGITKTIIEYSLEFSNLEFIASLQLDLEELFYTSNFKPISKKLIKSDASELKFKTDAEMAAEAEDGCGGACTI
jgi:hypothetical protein